MADEKRALRGRRRKRAIEELLSTEKTYVHLMSKLVEHYVMKLRTNTSMLSGDDYKILFPSDIHAILGLNQTFLEDLTKVIGSDTFNNENTKIGDILYTFCPHFVCKIHTLLICVISLTQIHHQQTIYFDRKCIKTIVIIIAKQPEFWQN